MTAAPMMRGLRRPRREARKRTKKPQAITLTAPKMPVRRRLVLVEPPATSLKYWGLCRGGLWG